MQKYFTPYRTTPILALIICYFLCGLLTSCTNESAKKPLVDDDLKLPYESIRYDQLFFGLDTMNVATSLDFLGKQYPDFTSLYVNTLTGLGVGQNAFKTDLDQSVKRFLQLKDYRDLYDTVQKHFPDIKSTDDELKELFWNINYFFPEEKISKVYYFISGLNKWSAITIDSTVVGVGLDMYLGKNFPHYKSLPEPINDYELHLREANRIQVDMARSVFQSKYPFEYEGKSLLDMMLYKGKELYFVEEVCRKKTDDIIVGYEKEKLNWCNENEEGIYFFFVKHKLLYTKVWQDIMPYVNDGPSTAGMPIESPGNIGSWLGWQIVRKYMKKHSDLPLHALMTLKLPAQQFLQDAKYKP